MLVNGIRYQVTRTGTGTALILLHGFTGSSVDWSLLVPYFAQQYQVITIDFLGHGETDSPTDAMRYALKHLRRDLITIIQDCTTSPAHLLGYSMGGRIALYLAVNHTNMFRSLILESASPGIADEEDRIARKESDDDLADRIEQGGITAFVDEWEEIPLWDSQRHLPEAVRRQVRIQRLQNNPIGLGNSLRGYGTGVQPSLWDKLGTLTLPTLLIAGALDKGYTAAAQLMNEQLPTNRMRIIPRAGHNVHLENPRGYANEVLDFLGSFSTK